MVTSSNGVTADDAKPPKSSSPSTRQKVDWEAVERDYRTSQFTDAELGAKHGVSREAIVRRRARDQKKDPSTWAKDLGPHVRAATNALLMQDLIGEKVTEDHKKVTGVVLAAAETNKQVILGHRADIKRVRNIGVKLMEELELATLMAAEHDAIAELLATVGEDGEVDADRLFKMQQTVRKALELPSRILSAKALAETLTKLQGLERIAFGMDDKGGDGAGEGGGKPLTDAERAVRLMHFLAKARQAQDVEPRDG